MTRKAFSEQLIAMNSGWRKIKRNGWAGMLDQNLAEAEAFWDLCCSEPKDASVFEKVQSSTSTRVLRFKAGGQTYYFKEFRYSGLVKQLKVRRRGVRLQRIATELIKAGFETPRIVCHARRGTSAFVVSEAADATTTAYDILMRQTDMAPRDVQRFQVRFGKEIGRLHAAGFVHGDLRWGNILVRDEQSDAPAFVFIDNDRTRKYRKIPSSLRVKNLVQIKFPGALLDGPESDWDSMWEGYLAGNPEAMNNADRWRKRVDIKNAKRMAAWWKKPRNRHLLKQRLAEEERPA